ISIACALFCAALAPLYAQQGGLAGSILDQAGKAIPGATVTVKNDTAIASTTTTDSNGHFAATGLAAGTYNVEATAPGFARGIRVGAPVGAGKSDEVSITLNVDPISQSVT